MTINNISANGHINIKNSTITVNIIHKNTMNKFDGLTSVDVIIKLNTEDKYIDFTSDDFIFNNNEMYYIGSLNLNQNIQKQLSIKLNYEKLKIVLSKNYINPFASISFGNILFNNNVITPIIENGIYYYNVTKTKKIIFRNSNTNLETNLLVPIKISLFLDINYD